MPCTWFIRRFPARDRRWRMCSPEDASSGAVPVQEANRIRSANLAMSPTSARIRGGSGRPDAGDVHQARAVGDDRGV
jgi:hypothetical protein